MSDQEWFYIMKGQQQGPVALDVLRTLVGKGRLSSGDQVWKAGMAGWMEVSNVAELKAGLGKEVKPSSEEGVSQMLSRGESEPSGNIYEAPKAVEEEENVYQAPKAVNELLSEREGLRYGGLTRLPYALTACGLFVALIVVFAVLDEEYVYELEGDFLYNQLLSLPFLIISKFRLKNLGMSGWNLLWAFVPIGNIWLQYRLLVCPEGYHHHESMDTAGKILLTLYISFIVIAIGLVIWGIHLLGDMGI